VPAPIDLLGGSSVRLRPKVTRLLDRVQAGIHKCRLQDGTGSCWRRKRPEWSFSKRLGGPTRLNLPASLHAESEKLLAVSCLIDFAVSVCL
jgi:hypothetical protein